MPQCDDVAKTTGNYPMQLPNLLASKNGRLTAFFLLYVTEGIPLGFAATAVATRCSYIWL